MKEIIILNKSFSIDNYNLLFIIFSLIVILYLSNILLRKRNKKLKNNIYNKPNNTKPDNTNTKSNNNNIKSIKKIELEKPKDKIKKSQNKPIYDNEPIRDNNDFIYNIAEIRGTYSERCLINVLTEYFDDDLIFHDLYVHKYNNTYSQIDIVVLSKIGILVFEVKDYNGWLFGTVDNKEWTQILNYGRNKYKFYNPVKQNESHIRSLSYSIKDKNIPYFNIVVFYGDCEFRNIDLKNSNACVCYYDEVKYYINYMLEHLPEIKYDNKKNIINILNESVNNGENYGIVESHRYYVDYISNK